MKAEKVVSREFIDHLWFCGKMRGGGRRRRNEIRGEAVSEVTTLKSRSALMEVV